MTEGRLRLIITRHAKSAWDDPALEDHDRPLNARGLKQACELGDWLASRGYEPEEVFCSSAKRTRETWAGIESAVLHTRPDVHILPKLYNADPVVLLQKLQSAQMPVVMMIGHNPGIADFASMLLQQPPNTAEFKKYPTAATTVIDFFEDSWATTGPGKGQLLEFFKPFEE
ncbi:MAG: histidine phosphatase family protein [Deltaproteobacteria bacterium]